MNGTLKVLKVKQEVWIWLNAIKGNDLVYLPRRKQYLAMASGSMIPGDAVRQMTADGLIREKQREREQPVLVYIMTKRGIESWEALPDGIESVYGVCEGCKKVKDLRPIRLGGVLDRFIYGCVDCREQGKF